MDGGLGKVLRLSLDAVPGLPGDHNGDGNVDILDYVVWRMDPANNGGDEGFEDWASEYGNPPGSGSGQAQGSAVPEPATCGMFLVISLVCLFSRAIRRC